MNPLLPSRARHTAPWVWLHASITSLGILAIVATFGFAQAGSPQEFSNPPLLYQGPDPTANSFLPLNSSLPSATPSAANITPLPPAEFSTSPSLRGQNLPPQTTAPDSTVPQSLTPSAMIRRFTSPHTSYSTQGEPGSGSPPETITTPSPLDRQFGQGELIYSSEMPGDASTSFWPSDDMAIDRHVLHDGGLTENKDGFFQSFSVRGTWIDRNNKPDDFGLSEVDVLATFALPLPSRDWPLLITPAFNTRFLEGPDTANLPSRLYETYLDLTWVPRLSSRWTVILGVAPSIYSDFEDVGEGFRVTGKGLVRYDWRPGKLQAILGVLYLGREDIAVLPAGGLIWTPNDRQKYELLFPRPKLAHLIRREARYEDWLYIGAEFGGNSYSIERIPGTTEKITLRDYRTYIGLERKLNGGAGFRLEIGYVAGRVIEFASGLPDVEADETAMIRGGITF